jgi:hypothetical protein
VFSDEVDEAPQRSIVWVVFVIGFSTDTVAVTGIAFIPADPESRAMVSVGPPLLASDPRSTFALFLLPVAVKSQEEPLEIL